MRFSAKYRIPRELALLYDFANSLDERRYVEHGVAHDAADAFATAGQCEAWMQTHGLLEKGRLLHKGEHAQALALRDALRAFLQQDAAGRQARGEAARRLTRVCAAFPLVLAVDGPTPALQPAPGASPLGVVVAEFHALAQADKLDRLKMCASEDCRWVFFDRSRPGIRRWCSSAVCGNRHKTRAYRERQAAAKDKVSS